MAEPSEIGKKIRTHLRRTGKPLRGLAQETEVSPSTLSQLLTGKRQGLHYRTFEKLAPFIRDEEVNTDG